MNIRQNSLITKAISFVSASAIAALIGLPALAQSTIRYDVRPGSEVENSPSSPAPSAGTATTDPAYGNPSVDQTNDQTNRPLQSGNMNRPESSTERGPNTVGEGVPGPSETPSGSPSVPGTSTYDNPSEATETDASGPSSPIRREALNNPSGTPSGTNGSTQGPSVVPGETYPGASETPSGSPSVPGNSQVDDPGTSRDSSRPATRQEALNEDRDSNINQTDDVNQTGPSVAPGETYPGASETPSGSPSVPGNSQVDDPGTSR